MTAGVLASGTIPVTRNLSPRGNRRILQATITAPRKPLTRADKSIREPNSDIEIQHLGLIDYEEVWRLQADLAAKRAKDLIPDQSLVLGHSSLYTAGERTQPEDRPINGLSVADVDRGGRITWYNPGQLVMYPTIKLAQPVNVMDYVHRLEGALIQTVRRAGIAATGRIDGRSGVWVPASNEKSDRKIAALDIRVTRGVTIHRLGLNCDNPMEFYNYIIPCGISDAGVTILSRELGRDVSMSEMTESLLANLQDVLEGCLTVANHSSGPAPNSTRDLPHRAKHDSTTGIFEYSSAKKQDETVTVKPEGRKLLCVGARNAQTPIKNKPRWIRNQARPGPSYKDMENHASGAFLHTVCQETGCSNIHEYWEDHGATLLVGGDKCTRRRDFCQTNPAKSDPLDKDGPRRVVESVREIGLHYATITGVARNDLPGGASWLYAETCRQIHELNPNAGIELLVDDFHGDESVTQQISDTKSGVFAHNLETVPRISKRICPAFRYKRSLGLITRTHEAGLVTKSNLTLGVSEPYSEITPVMEDLRRAGRDILIITQYLCSTPLHHLIERWVKPEEFAKLSRAAEEVGFAGVMLGPLVRPSYRAERLYARALAHRGQELPVHLSTLTDDDDNNLALQEASILLDHYGVLGDTPVTSAIPVSQRLTAAMSS